MQLCDGRRPNAFGLQVRGVVQNKKKRTAEEAGVVKM